MKKNPLLRFAFINPRLSLALFLISIGVLLTLLGSGVFAAAGEQQAPQENSGIQFGQSYHNDESPALRDLPAMWPPLPPTEREEEQGRNARRNPKLPHPGHVDVPDPLVGHGFLGLLIPEAMPATILNFDGIPFTGAIPPDTNGAVGATQYAEIVNESYQVFNKSTGGSFL